MADWPAPSEFKQGIIFDPLGSAAGPGPVMNTNNNTYSITATGWPQANRAIYVSIIVSSLITVYQFATDNIATVAGTTDVGLYTLNGTRLVSSGAVTMTGANAVQVFDVTDTPITPGYYYMAMNHSEATATFRCTTPNAQILRICGVQMQDVGAAALPATATFAAMGSGYLPHFTMAAYATVM
jgi:hypothetical protein